MSIRINDIAYHRNGVAGAGFYVVRFRHTTRERGRAHARNMIGIVFDEPRHVAVLDINQAAQGNITPGSNSWRCEDYEPELRAAVQRWEGQRAVAKEEPAS